MSRLLIALCLFLQAQTQPVYRLYPVDDAGRDPGFRSYVRKLKAAVEGRKADALRKLVDPEVVVGPGDDDKGWAKFVARWRPEDRQNPAVWDALSELLSLGFVREHPRLFVSPYLVFRFPSELNMARNLVVVRDKAALREAPSLNAREAAWLSFDIVERLGPTEASGLNQWIPVRTPGGESGYVNARDVMSPMMPRAQFGIRNGRWTMIALEGPER